jgi:hypothetical protein
MPKAINMTVRLFSSWRAARREPAGGRRNRRAHAAPLALMFVPLFVGVAPRAVNGVAALNFPHGT